MRRPWSPPASHGLPAVADVRVCADRVGGVTVVRRPTAFCRRHDRAGGRTTSRSDRLFDLHSQPCYNVRRRRRTAYGGAIFHLFCHAFFKAAACPLRRLGDHPCRASRTAQDGRHLAAGGMTYILMWIGSLAGGIGIPGVSGFAGFYSKTPSRGGVGGHTAVAIMGYWLGALAAGMTGLHGGGCRGQHLPRGPQRWHGGVMRTSRSAGPPLRASCAVDN